MVASPAGAISSTTGAPPTETSTSSLTQPITIVGGGKNYMNISFDGMFALAGSTARDLDHIEVGDHDPQQRGFNARNIELAFDGAVDPYFEGFANIVFKLDNDNETEVEVEEAFMQTTNLPFGLQLKGGQFFAAFGRINPTHPHTWDFADDPLGARSFARTRRIAWGRRANFLDVAYAVVFPTHFRRRRTDAAAPDFLFAIQATMAFSSIAKQPIEKCEVSRISSGFRAGRIRLISARRRWCWREFPARSVRTKPGANSRTQIYGGDLFYKWKSAHAEGGFPFVKWQTEVMYRRFEAGRGVDETFSGGGNVPRLGIVFAGALGFSAKAGWQASAATISKCRIRDLLMIQIGNRAGVSARI